MSRCVVVSSCPASTGPSLTCPLAGLVHVINKFRVKTLGLAPVRLGNKGPHLLAAHQVSHITLCVLRQSRLHKALAMSAKSTHLHKSSLQSQTLLTHGQCSLFLQPLLLQVELSFHYQCEPSLNYWHLHLHLRMQMHLEGPSPTL